MKKICFLAVILPLFTMSCSNDNEASAPGTGSISLVPSVSIETENVGSRSTTTDFTNYSVVLDGPGGATTMDYPSSGKIDNLQTGQYTVTVTSHPHGFIPAFDEQVYVGSATLTVSSGETAAATIVCKQANAGVFFDYSDPSLTATGLTDLVPTITMGDHALVYSGENHEATGYFNPGNATLTLKNGGQDVNLNNQGSVVMELGPEQLRKVTLKATGTRASSNNDVIITVSVE